MSDQRWVSSSILKRLAMKIWRMWIGWNFWGMCSCVQWTFTATIFGKSGFQWNWSITQFNFTLGKGKFWNKFFLYFRSFQINLTTFSFSVSNEVFLFEKGQTAADANDRFFCISKLNKTAAKYLVEQESKRFFQLWSIA